MTNDENPALTCTPYQIAFVAWQCRRAGMTTDTSKVELCSEGERSAEFRAWFDEHWPFKSTRDAARRAWLAASAPHEGELLDRRFAQWWKTIVLDQQPVVV